MRRYLMTNDRNCMVCAIFVKEWKEKTAIGFEFVKSGTELWVSSKMEWLMHELTPRDGDENKKLVFADRLRILEIVEIPVDLTKGSYERRQEILEYSKTHENGLRLALNLVEEMDR